MSTPPSARILVVCTGNVCRSPLIERVLQRDLDEAYGSGAVEVVSAGTGALVGSAMDERSAQVLAALGGSDEGFVAQHLGADHVAAADLVITATQRHRTAVVRLQPRALQRTFTLRELARLVQAEPLGELPTDPPARIRALVDLAVARKRTLAGLTAEELDVVDPYRRSDEVYEEMRDQVEPALAVLGRALTGRP